MQLPLFNELKPLNITCTSSDCPQNLHCFRTTQRLVKANLAGRCRSCGADLIDWERVHQLNCSDAPYTFNALQYEMVRHHFWHREIDDLAVAHARRKGRVGIRKAAEKRIRCKVGPANPPFDGRQTPASGNVIYYAQHATASCCRKCMEEWHGIPPDQALTEDQIQYLTELATMYINQRLPFLTEDGECVSRKRSSKTVGDPGPGK